MADQWFTEQVGQDVLWAKDCERAMVMAAEAGMWGAAAEARTKAERIYVQALRSLLCWVQHEPMERTDV